MILPGLLAMCPGLGFGPLKMAAMALGLQRHRNTQPRPLLPYARALLAVAVLSASLSTDPILSALGYSETPFYGVTAMALVYLAYVSVDLELAPVARWAVLLLTAGSLMPWTMQDGRAGSFMGSPVFLGAVYVVLFPYLKGWSIVLAAIGVALAKSKGAALGILAGLMAAQYVRGRLRAWHVDVALVACLALGTVMAARGLSDSDWGRVELVRYAAATMADYPVLGSGPDTFILEMRRRATAEYRARLGADSAQASAHNDIAQVGATLGAAGLAAYLMLWWAAWRLAVRRADARVAAVLAGLFVQAKFNPIPVVVHVIAAVAVAGVRPARPAP